MQIERVRLKKTRHQRREAIIDLLRPACGLKKLEGRINRVQVFEKDDSFSDYVVTFETDRGTINWFANRNMLRELGRRLRRI